MPFPPASIAMARKNVCDPCRALRACKDLHIWGMSTTETALTAHLIRPNVPTDDGFLHHSAQELKDRFRIDHATIQIETGDSDECRLAPTEVV
jgi:cobalt-zinc-cadmium efflux system protein